MANTKPTPVESFDCGIAPCDDPQPQSFAESLFRMMRALNRAYADDLADDIHKCIAPGCISPVTGPRMYCDECLTLQWEERQGYR